MIWSAVIVLLSVVLAFSVWWVIVKLPPWCATPDCGVSEDLYP